MMFTGIIEAVAQITEFVLSPEGARLTLQTHEDFCQGLQQGDSVAVNGVCLTAVAIGRLSFSADLSLQTLSCTTCGTFVVGDKVNLERALTLQKPLGGHCVSGHVDTTTQILKREQRGQGIRFECQMPQNLAHYVVNKGSVTLDGVSLTVCEDMGDRFAVELIPHTLQVTTLSGWQAGSKVNMEIDLLARYLEKMLPATGEAAKPINLTTNKEAV